MAKIYAACLASYNNGILYGSWIDCEGKNAADISKEISEMLAKSPCPNVTRYRCRECGAIYSTAPKCCRECDSTSFESFASAEEYAIHDYDFESGIRLDEYSSLETIAAAADVDSMMNEPGMCESRLRVAISEADSYAPLNRETIEDSLGRVFGPYDSEREYIEEYVDESGMLEGVPDIVRYHFDYESYQNDLECGGLHFEYDSGKYFAVWNT